MKRYLLGALLGISICAVTLFNPKTAPQVTPQQALTNRFQEYFNQRRGEYWLGAPSSDISQRKREYGAAETITKMMRELGPDHDPEMVRMYVRTWHDLAKRYGLDPDLLEKELARVL